MITAAFVYLLASTALIALEQKLAHLARNDRSLAWLSAHLYVPLARTLVLVAFVLLAYPALLGLEAAPPLGLVLRDGHADVLITTLFCASLALPLVPVVRAVPGAVLAGQGILACCLLTSWVAAALGAPEPRLWMGWLIALQVLAILIAGRYAARALIALYPRDPGAGFAAMAGEAARLASELPVVALYGWALGRQLVPFVAD